MLLCSTYSGGLIGSYLSDLTKVAEQGVLWLNTCLTVRAHKAHSHSKQGWETFTTAVLKAVTTRSITTEEGETRKGVVFLAWGAPALKICQAIGVNGVSICFALLRNRSVNLSTSVKEEPFIEVKRFLVFLVKSLALAHVRYAGLPIPLLCPQIKGSWGMATSKLPTNGSRKNTTTTDQSTGPFSILDFYQRSVYLTRFFLLAWHCLLSVTNIPVPR